MPPKIRAVLAEDHALVAHGLRALLRDSVEFVGIVNDARALLEAVETLHPDVIVTDISMPKIDGIDAIRQIRSRFKDAKIVVLTVHRDERLAAEAFRAGASAYMLKTSPVEELINAIRQVAAGRAYVATSLLKDLLTHLLRANETGAAVEQSPLTPRQREVLKLIAGGRTMKDVASILKISTRTAESHKYGIMQTLGLANSALLIQYAIREGFVAV